jgi:predicted N-acyltransferase
MRKTFQLQVEGKHPDRLLEAIKHEIRKYIKRERRRVLPEGSDFWDFDCKFGAAEESAEVVHLSAITGLIDGVVKEAGTQFYVELVAKPGKRAPRAAGERAQEPSEED